jgi:hypothetical protein
MPGVTGLDTATVTGWAHVEESVLSIMGTWNLRCGARDSRGMLYLRLRARLKEYLAAAKPELVVYEAAGGHLRGAHTLELQHGLMAEVQSGCHTAGVEYVAVPPSTLKKWAAGKGNVDKKTMVALANETWKKECAACGLPYRPITDDNKADAYLLALAGRAFLAGELHL